MPKFLKNSKITENIFIIIYIGIFLWMSIGPIFQYRMVHDRPFGFGASDSYAWFAHAQNIYDSGNFKYNAPFMNLNLEGFTSPEPPLFVQFTAFLSYALGIPLYDAQILLGGLLIIFSILIFFMLIKQYSPFLAYLSLPLCILSFTYPFITGWMFGFLPAIFGFLFLFASLFMLFHINFRYSTLIMGIFISAMIIGHTVRIFEFVFFGGIFIALALLFRKINWNFIKKFIISVLLSFIISLYYLSIFKQRLFENIRDSFSFSPSDAAQYLRINLSDFGFVKYVIIIGLVLCLYFLIKERNNLRGLIFSFPITAFLLVYFLRVSRIYQIAFFWPVFLSMAFGLVLFSLLQLRWFSKINKNKLTYFAISLVISLMLIYQGYYSLVLRSSLEQMSEEGVMTKNRWDSLMWIAEDTDPNSKILFFYFNDDTSYNIYHFFPSKRLSSYVSLPELDFAIEQKIIKKDYKILDNSLAYFYKRDSKFPLKIISIDKNIYLKNMTICDFDYIYGKRKVQVINKKNEKFVYREIEDRTLYTIELMNTLLKNKNFRLVYQNAEASIIKNDVPGGDCI